MKEINGTRLAKAALSRVRSSAGIFCLLLMLLCFVSGVPGTSFLCWKELSIGATQPVQNGREELRPTASNLPGRLSPGNVPAKSNQPVDRVWREIKWGNLTSSHAGTVAMPKFYRALSLNETAQKQLLRRAPMEFTKASRDTQVIMTLPMPDGTFARFRVEESPIMAPQLAARFPEIRTYRGKGLDDPTATTRFDVTPAGFQAIVLSAHGTVIIEPAARGHADNYISYDQRDAPKDAGSFHCLFSDADQSLVQPQSKQFLHSGYATLSTPTGATLRTYRLALAATAEYTQMYGGGTVSGAMSAMTTTINAVNAIYERDLTIRLMLVDNETAIIFTNTATDGYTSDNATSMFNENQAILDRVIGPSNYDIGFVLDGHAFTYQRLHFLFEGQGQFQSACVSGQKGKGVSILRSIEPSTTSAIWEVAHEMGHKFGALHTFNGTTTDDCLHSRTASTAYEPGTGSTIMAYRGGFAPDGNYLPLCEGDDLQSTDTYFHTASIEQIVNYTTFGSGSFCPTLTDTGNNPPTVDAGQNYTIPANTPFTLMAAGSDAEGDALTYCWEEFDLGAPAPPNTDNGNRPIFRSFAPVPSPARTFPRLTDILSGTTTFGESLPTTTRTMNFHVTVRDNHPGGGGVNTGAMRVNVSAGSGPFTVTQPDSSIAWKAGSTQTITWNVANTSSAPVNCVNVRVLLSIDGGSSFPITLAQSTPNNGTAMIIVPNTPTSTARVKVEAIGNIFFGISLPNFIISANSAAAPTLLTEENTNRAVALDSVTFVRDPFPLTTINNFSLDERTRVTLFAVGLELLPGEDVSVVTAQIEDAEHRIYPLTVEYVGKIPNFGWLTQVNVRLPDGFANARDVWVSISLRGAVSNKAVIGIR
jgi:uncharacterized protein (TIGR03437 family)